jgi:guanidinopropionase
VANLEPLHAGLRPNDIMRILHGLRGLNVIGGDIVCIIPTKDNPNHITAMNSMALMFEIIALIADRLHSHEKRV